MRALLGLSRVRLLAVMLSVVIVAFAGHWMLSSPLRGQDSGGEPLPNVEAAPGCDSDRTCSVGCIESTPPCPQIQNRISTCSVADPLCALCVCRPLLIGGQWVCKCRL
jgi:hypothetical protein